MIDLLQRRRLIMTEAGESPTPPTPPYDAKVEYLACTGAGEKIDTGFNPTNKTRVTGTVLLAAEKSVFFCSRWTSGANTNTFTFYDAPTCLMAMADHDGTQYRRNLLINDSRRLNNVLDIDFDLSDVYVKLNGTSIANGTLSRGTFTSTSPIIFFNLADAYMAICRIYGAKIYENGTLVHSYIPVRVGTTGYLYDEVAGELKGNVGSGAFTYGNDITI